MSERERLSVPIVSPEIALATPRTVFVDLRSPAEFDVDHVPGAINAPLFDDVERAVVGTLYRQESPEAAFAEGLGRVRERVRGLVEEIAAASGWSAPGEGLVERMDALVAGGFAGLDRGLVPEPVGLPEQAVVLYCWRGGMRSRSVVTLVRELGLRRAVALEGGYKAYRALVRGRLADWEAPPTVVLRGLTGVGKTLVLRELERLRPGWTLDLEALAGHRSSILGMVGLEPCSQKTFETRLALRLEAGFPAGLSVMEGESRKVGDIVLPPAVWQALSTGTSLHLVASPERRIDVLVADYLEREENRPAIAAQLPFIEQRIGCRKWGGQLVSLLEERRERELVAILLEHYYDPLYRHSERTHSYAATIDANDPAEAAQRIAAWVESRQLAHAGAPNPGAGGGGLRAG